MINEQKHHAFPMMCFVSQLNKSACISTSCQHSDCCIHSPFHFRNCLVELPNLPGVMEGGLLESWGGFSPGAICPIRGVQGLGAVLDVQGKKLLFRITMCERPPFVSLSLIPAQFLSPMTKIKRSSEMMDNSQRELLGKRRSIV